MFREKSGNAFPGCLNGAHVITCANGRVHSRAPCRVSHLLCRDLKRGSAVKAVPINGENHLRTMSITNDQILRTFNGTAEPCQFFPRENETGTSAGVMIQTLYHQDKLSFHIYIEIHRERSARRLPERVVLKTKYRLVFCVLSYAESWSCKRLVRVRIVLCGNVTMPSIHQPIHKRRQPSVTHDSSFGLKSDSFSWGTLVRFTISPSSARFLVPLSGSLRLKCLRKDFEGLKIDAENEGTGNIIDTESKTTGCNVSISARGCGKTSSTRMYPTKNS